MTINRRSVLSVVGAGAVALAGCSGGDDDGPSDDGGSGDGTDVEPGSITDGFSACSTPAEDTLEEMFPAVEDFGEDVEPGFVVTGDDPWEFRSQGYDSGDIGWNMAIIKGDSSFDELNQTLRLQLQEALQDSTPIVAYVSAEEYILYASGTDESDARDRLAAFTAVSEDCANQAATISEE